MIRTYLLLTKPGIILGNLITTAGGFSLASKGTFNLNLFLFTIIGLGLVIASACVFNNYRDRHIDEIMQRTKTRPLAQKLITEKKALLFASISGMIGFFILAVYTNFTAATTAFLGFFIYVVVYGTWKYKSTSGTIIGSIAGAIPPVVGYTAVSNKFDLGAFLLFMILLLWQMPHFFAITLFRLEDYKNASMPVLPIKKGARITKIYMLCYIAAFIIAAWLLSFFGYTGDYFLFTILLLGLVWFSLCLMGFKTKDDTVWSRDMFRLSLVIILILSLMVSIDTIYTEKESQLRITVLKK